MIEKLFYAMTLILLVPLSSFAEIRRDWVDGQNLSYPREQYLVGVGYGNTRETAEKNAYAAISKIFSAKISSINKDYERYLETTRTKRPDTYKEIVQITEVTSNKILDNVNIAETWLDKEEKVYYVLAVIERTKAGTSLKERILSLDSEIENMVKKSRETKDKVQKIRMLILAIKNLIQREAYNLDLMVINLSGRGIESPFSIVSLNNELQSFLKNDFAIGVEVRGEKGSYVERAIIEGLNKEGLSIAPRGQTGDLIVKGEVEFKDVYTHDPTFKFIRWTANFKLIEKNTDKVIGSINRSGKEGHITIEDAKEKALKTMQEEIVNEVGKRVADFIYQYQGILDNAQ